MRLLLCSPEELAPAQQNPPQNREATNEAALLSPVGHTQLVWLSRVSPMLH